jgi:hypothetical protein
MVVVSKRLRFELLKKRAAGHRQYEIAAAARLHPTMLSALLHMPVRHGDPRVVRLGALFGLRPRDCFDQEDDQFVDGGNSGAAA